jgi:hypothetical protein
MHDSQGKFLLRVSGCHQILAYTMGREDYAGAFPTHAEVVSKLAKELEIETE